MIFNPPSSRFLPNHEHLLKTWLLKHAIWFQVDHRDDLMWRNVQYLVYSIEFPLFSHPQSCGDAHRPRVFPWCGAGVSWLWCCRRTLAITGRLQGHSQVYVSAGFYYTLPCAYTLKHTVTPVEKYQPEMNLLIVKLHIFIIFKLAP